MAEHAAASKRVILAMDGSTTVSTAALLAPGDRPPGYRQETSSSWGVLARRVDTDSRGHARALLRLADDMLKETGRDPEDIAAIVCGVGPGTFTGVRIAVATARGLALALDTPVFGVGTLSALAACLAGDEAPAAAAGARLLVPVVDARRGQVFYGLYRRMAGASDTFERTEAFGVCDRDALSSVVPYLPDTVIVGDVALLSPTGPGSGSRGPRLVALQVGAEHLVLGQSRLSEPGWGPEGARLDGWLRECLSSRRNVGSRPRKPGEIGSPETVRPIYVRTPDADMHITKMKDPWAGSNGER